MPDINYPSPSNRPFAHALRDEGALSRHTHTGMHTGIKSEISIDAIRCVLERAIDR